MNDNLIGLIILIVAFNVFARIVRAVTRATKQPPARREPSAPHAPDDPVVKPGHAAEQPFESPVAFEDDGPFAWAGKPERAALPPTEPSAPVPSPVVFSTADEKEFMEHSVAEWSLKDTFAAPAPARDTAGDFPEVYSDWSDEIREVADAEDLITSAVAVAPPAGTVVGAARIERRWSGLRRMVVQAAIIAPCRAAAPRRQPRFPP